MNQNPDPNAVPLSEVFDPEAYRALALEGFLPQEELPWEANDTPSQEG